jgi:peptidoglycan/LPS O-acetylase OafA/YrhL
MRNGDIDGPDGNRFYPSLVLVDPPRNALPCMTDPAPRSLRALTSLRFFAALAVALYHVPFVLSRSVGMTVLPNGGLGVSFFFILSGFILRHVHPESDFSLVKFYRHRAARILPLHYLTLIIWTTLFFTNWGNGLTEKINSGVANILLLQAFFSGPLFTLGYNAVSWSISVELFFYALFPFLLRGHRCFIVFLSYVFVFLLMPHGISQWLQAAFGDFFYFNPLARLLEFVCGMSLHALFRAWVPRMSAASVLQAGSLLLLVVAVPATSGMATHLRNVALLLPFSAIILTFAWDGVLSGLLSGSVVVMLGEASFAFYLTHHMYFQIADHLILASEDAFKMRIGHRTALTLALSSAIVLSVAVFLLFERPVRSFLTRGGRSRAGAVGRWTNWPRDRVAADRPR